jgi:hypothetical protein
MPFEGPEKQVCYLPSEAYDVLGSQLFGSRWTSPFTLGEMLPHPPAAKHILEKGGPDAERLLAFGDPDSDDYKRRQINSRRTQITLARLRETLRWGKAPAFQHNEFDWEEISVYDWDSDDGVYAELVDDIRAHHTDDKPSLEKIAILQTPFDIWVGKLQQQVVDPNEPLRPTRLPGRPSFDYQVFRDQLAQWDIDGTLSIMERISRRQLSDKLYKWHSRAFPHRKLPNPDTIRKNLKRDFDNILRKY